MIDNKLLQKSSKRRMSVGRYPSRIQPSPHMGGQSAQAVHGQSSNPSLSTLVTNRLYKHSNKNLLSMQDESQILELDQSVTKLYVPAIPHVK